MDSVDQKELAITKVVILSIIVIVFGILLFAYKTDSCKSSPEQCHDTFIEFNSSYSQKCDLGAVMEPVKDPKPGVICHCAPDKSIDGGLK